MNSCAGLLLGIAFLSAGCSTFHTEVGRPLPQNLQTMKEGETRMETVVHELGPPHVVSSLPNGCVFLYEYSRVFEFQWGLSLNMFKMPYFKLVQGNSRLSESAIVLIFDDQGVLQAQEPEVWKEKLGAGGALQLVVSGISLTDTTAFRRLPDPLLWGRGSLQRPAATLNSAQDLRTGRSGLQQRLAPVFVGQGSLEMPHPNPLKARRQKRWR